MADRRSPVRVEESRLAPGLTDLTYRSHATVAQRVAVMDSLCAIMDSQVLAFHIQQVCGVTPLAPPEEERFAALREIRERRTWTVHEVEIRDAMTIREAERVAAYRSLVQRLPCTHCAARDRCPAAHARPTN